MKETLAAFFAPILIAVLLLYRVLADLQIALTHDATLRVIAIALSIAVAAGLLAALGPSLVRVGVLAASALVLLDATAHLSGVFDRLSLVGRDTRRIADLDRIKAALEEHIRRFGTLPRPAEYGEASGLPDFWIDWWDMSAEDVDGDGTPFLDFLVDSGTMASVPVDPEPEAPRDGDPRGGRQYVYLVVPPDYKYQGGLCAAAEDRWLYLLGVTDLQSEPSRPPKNIAGSGCGCLWRDRPNFFQEHFDYVVCGTFSQ